MTKAEERKALEQIKKIIVSTGKDSYIAAAFEGCADLAEENINNDFLSSWKARALHIEAELMKTRADKDAIQTERSIANVTIDTLQKRIDQLEDSRENTRAAWQEKAEEVKDLKAALTAQQERSKEQARQIMKLKAKLYDLMNPEQ